MCYEKDSGLQNLKEKRGIQSVIQNEQIILCLIIGLIILAQINHKYILSS